MYIYYKYILFVFQNIIYLGNLTWLRNPKTLFYSVIHINSKVPHQPYTKCSVALLSIYM